MRYEQYRFRDEYKYAPRTYGCFAIVKQPFDGGVGVIIKQRNGKGSAPYQFDLPGGGLDEEKDRNLASAALREASEEIGIEGEVVGVIGQPLWLPITKDGSLVRVDCAAAFLVDAGAQIPETSEEALTVAVVNEHSARGFSIVGLTNDKDPTRRVFGRTPIMLWDGLSITKNPFYSGPIPSEIGGGCRFESGDFGLIDDGNYFARYDATTTCVKLFYRLNPFEPTGRFVGKLEHLAQG